ncbi:MAG: hypothetical protein HY431_01360 [Candidatus Levybacteria bacterium]|nr:hypothetical protein [Candidatus Levybacteria bacterium]
MKKQRNSHSLALGLTIVILFGLLLLGYFVARSTKNLSSVNNYQQPNTSQNTTFQSKNLKFIVLAPKNFEIEESFTSVIFKNEEGEIVLGRSGTNFKKLEEYLEDLSIKNRATITNRQYFNGQPNIVKGRIRYQNIQTEKEIYFIYNDNWVYSLSTDSEALFDDLDEIAKSFRYRP